MPINETARYLTVTGVLFPDNRLLLQPGFVTEQPHYSEEDRESDVTAELVDEGGRLLLRRHLPVSSVCGDGGRVDSWIIAAKIPFPENTRALILRRDDVVLLEQQRPRREPALSIRWAPRGRPRERQRVTWTVDEPVDAELRYLVEYSHDGGRTWRTISPPLDITEYTVDFASLPGGDRCRIRVTVTDGFNTVSSETRTFAVPVKSCLAMILAPEDGIAVRSDEMLMLQGQGYYLEEARPELEQLEWRSSVVGRLGQGAVVAVPSLPRGPHRITLGAGTGDRIGTTSIEITVT